MALFCPNFGGVWVQILMKIDFRCFLLFICSQDDPGKQLVDARWKLTFDSYLSSAKDFVVALVDVRGSGANGDTFKHAVFRQIGVFETKDSYHVLK